MTRSSATTDEGLVWPTADQNPGCPARGFVYGAVTGGRARPAALALGGTEALAARKQRAAVVFSLRQPRLGDACHEDHHCLHGDGRGTGCAGVRQEQEGERQASTHGATDACPDRERRYSRALTPSGMGCLS